MQAKMKRIDELNKNKGNVAHKLAEEEQDLKSILSDEQCQDLLQLTCGITKRMRKTIEENFDATATLEKLRRENENEDGFANLDFDPGTVDVSAYDKERKVRDERQKELSTPQMKELKKASLKWFDEWQNGFIQKVKETLSVDKNASQQPAQLENSKGSSLGQVQKLKADPKDLSYTTPKLEQLFPRIATSLTKLPISKRATILHSFLLLLLSSEHYTAASRVFLLYLASSLKLGLKYLREDEEKTAKGLLEVAKQMSASQEAMKKGKESEESRKWKMRLATVAGAAVVGLSGGYAAPLIAASVGAAMGELGLGASAAAGYLGTVAGNTYVVGSLFGAYGGRMTGDMMRNLSADVQDFAFLPVHGERKEHGNTVDAVTESRRLRVIISITGWLLEKEEVVSPWRVLSPSAEVFALRFELETLMQLGQSFNTMASNSAYGYAQSAFATRAAYTELSSAIWPLALVKIARVIENPFSLAKTRADKAGKVLAEALISRTQGERPVTLIGYSLGARVIWSCLTALAERRGFGLVESAVMIGAPIPSDTNTWRKMRTAVSGRLVNVYSSNDYLLGFLHRASSASSIQHGVAGLGPISGLLGVENVDVSEDVPGHLRYRYLIGTILQKIGFEDIDKTEVAKEAEAYSAMVEEEEKQDYYTKEAKQLAGEAYQQYQKRVKRETSKKISDADADKQAKAMEKEVQQKTQKGLMQWAAEQLYLSPPAKPTNEDVEDAVSDPQAAAKGARKSAEKMTDAMAKTVYQRAKEAVYISRSGGAQGELAAKNKTAQAQNAAASAQAGYLATAAGYIPTGYIPSFRSAKASGKSKAASSKLPKDAKGKRPSAGHMSKLAGKQSEKSKARAESASTQASSSKAILTPTTTIPDEERIVTPETEEPIEGMEKPEDEAGDSAPTATDSAKESESTPKAAAKDAHKVGGYTSYIPSFGFGSSSKQAGGNPKEEAKDASKSEKAENAKSEAPSGDKKDDAPAEPLAALEKNEAEGASDDAKEALSTPAKEDPEGKEVEGASEDAEETPPTPSKEYLTDENDEAAEKPAEGTQEALSTPIKESPEARSDEVGEKTADEAQEAPSKSTKKDPKDQSDEAAEKPAETSEDQTEKFASETEGTKTPKVQSAGYGSYVPSFGFGGSKKGGESKSGEKEKAQETSKEKSKEKHKGGLDDPFTD